MRSPSAIDTYLGGSFDVLHPSVDQVRIEDIAHHLSIINRYIGATRKAYSVAEHSTLVVRLMEGDGLHPELCFAGLMHDAHEAYVGDISSPIKLLLGESWRYLEDCAQSVVMRRFEVTWDSSVESLVKRYDLIARRAEAHCLMEGRGADWGWSEDVPLVLKYEIVPYLPMAAESCFLWFFRRYRPCEAVRTA